MPCLHASLSLVPFLTLTRALESGLRAGALALLTLLAPAALAQPQAALRMEAVRALPPLPKDFVDEPSLDARLGWLARRLQEPLSLAERYRTQRVLFLEYFFAHRPAEAAPLCKSLPPLRDDFSYREHCITATEAGGERQLPRLLELASEAQSLGNPAAAAQVLSSVAWQQSQAGDVAGAFAHYEAALNLVPSDRPDLLTDLMVDTATSYIVNGDEGYVRKGIELLRNARGQMERALQDPRQRSRAEDLRSGILLTEFNRGIAHVLHLGDYRQGLAHFDAVVQEPNPYRPDALVFAALAAAELAEPKRAQAYLAQAARGEASSGGPAVQQYLACYRQLAQRRWQAGLSPAACLALHPDTATEVQIDVYKRLMRLDDPALAAAGHKGLAALFVQRLEPQLRRRGSTAASRAELQRLQRESELKTVVLKQQEDLQRARDATAAQRQNTFLVLSLLLGVVVLLVALQWRAKKKLAEQYERLSVVDTLTQLGNRRFLEQHIGRELAHLQRARRGNPNAALGVFLFDIDHFKSINDRHGHAAGDEVLSTLARRIQAITRDTDLLVRWGGEEFLLVARLELPGHGEQVASRLLQAVNATPFDLHDGRQLPVSCTIGVVQLPFLPGDAAPAWDALVRLADLGLYEGKSRGRNCWVHVENAGIPDAAGLAPVLQQPLAQSVAEGRLRLRSG